MTSENVICMEPNILDLPYSNKRLIVIMPDDVKNAEIEVLKRTNASDTENGKNKNWAELALPAIASYMAERISPYALGIEFASGIYNGIKKLAQKEIDIVTVSSSQANNLVFPPGHPQKRCVYVGNPVNPKSYFPLAEVHRMMLESKFAEIISILMFLGAESIKVERIRGMGSEITIKCDVGLPIGDAVGGKVSREFNEEKSYIFEAKLNPSHKPKMPSNLVWYQFEPTWQVISNGRIEHGLQNFVLNVTYLENYGITTDLNLAVKGNGLSAGGEFKEHESTIWRISGTFMDIVDN